jgi:hypothetical protein
MWMGRKGNRGVRIARPLDHVQSEFSAYCMGKKNGAQHIWQCIDISSQFSSSIPLTT